MVTAAELIAAGRNFKRKTESLFGLPVTIRSLSGAGRDLLRSRAADGNPLSAVEILQLGVYGDDGSPLFTSEHLLELSDGDGDEIDRVAFAVLSLSGLGPNSQDDAAKN